MNLPEIYTRVVAAKPDLVVPHLSHDGHDWTIMLFDDFPATIPVRVAKALIINRWLEAAPRPFMFGDCDPLRQLAEFHVPGSTEETQ